MLNRSDKLCIWKNILMHDGDWIWRCNVADKPSKKGLSLVQSVIRLSIGWIPDKGLMKPAKSGISYGDFVSATIIALPLTHYAHRF